MAVSLREYRARIKSTESMKKITRAMELIAASRIIKAQQRAQAAAPYARELTRAVSAVATYSNVDHPLTTEPEDPKRAAILVITSDRGLAGAYSSSVLKEAERLRTRLEDDGQGGRHLHLRAQGRGLLPVPQPRDHRGVDRSQRPAELRGGRGDRQRPDRGLPQRRGRGADHRGGRRGPRAAPGVDEVHVVFTQFRSMLVQEPRDIRLLPLEVVEGEEAPESDEVLPLYEFEPSPEEVLDGLLPKYVQSRIFFALLQAAASELAARQKAMKSATDNADELIKKYTRTANQARQAGITQEISEIVGGVNALADANAGSE